jgi:circadian clock protein KaiC
MPAKHTIHITLSTETMSVLERYEQALLSMDKLRFKEKVDTRSISRIIKRAKTGIFAFDDFVECGIPEGFIVVLTGTPGTGKTTFSMHFYSSSKKG